MALHPNLKSPMSSSATGSEPSLDVICLCADWCGTCRDYASLFEQIRKTFAQVRFAWIDIEDEADLVEPIEVETFPTLLIARNGEPIFLVPCCRMWRRWSDWCATAWQRMARARQDPALLDLMARLRCGQRLVYIWSKTAPSAKCSFPTRVQPPKA